MLGPGRVAVVVSSSSVLAVLAVGTEKGEGSWLVYSVALVWLGGSIKSVGSKPAAMILSVSCTV